jgi:hypothetical protein
MVPLRPTGPTPSRAVCFVKCHSAQVARKAERYGSVGFRIKRPPRKIYRNGKKIVQTGDALCHASPREGSAEADNVSASYVTAGMDVKAWLAESKRGGC